MLKLPSISAENQHRWKIQHVSSTTHNYLTPWMAWVLQLSGQFSTTHPTVLYGPNTATRDQEVDETHATEDTQQETIDCV